MIFSICLRPLRIQELWIYAILHCLHLLVALEQFDGPERMRCFILLLFFHMLPILALFCFMIC